MCRPSPYFIALYLYHNDNDSLSYMLRSVVGAAVRTVSSGSLAAEAFLRTSVRLSVGERRAGSSSVQLRPLKNMAASEAGAREGPHPRTALVVVDMSVEQLGAIGYLKADVVAMVRALLESCAADAPNAPPFDIVVDSRLWIKDPSKTTLSKVFPDVGHADSTGAELLPELRRPWDAIPEDMKVFDPKFNYSSWCDTRLDELLRARGIERVCLAGVNTDYCIFASALDSFYRFYDTKILADAVTSMSGKGGHEEALDRMRAHFGATAVVCAADVAPELCP